MSKNRTKRLAPSVLLEDLATLDALDAIEDWSPSNPQFTKANAQAVRAAMVGKQTKENQDAVQAKASRDDSVEAEWDTHDFVIGVRQQGIAQYGEDGNEVQSLGLKKKSEYKKRTGRIRKEPEE